MRLLPVERPEPLAALIMERVYAINDLPDSLEDRGERD
jgi:hypothetical protein